MYNKKGCEVEFAMKRWFKGTHHNAGHVDFQTKKCLYEVKSCSLFNKSGNGNYARKSAGKQHNKVETVMLGRFLIINGNHEGLLDSSINEDKSAKYAFVIRIGKQNILRTKSWEFVNKLINKRKDRTWIRIKDIFGDECI